MIQKVGLIAGRGDFPLIFTKEAKKNGAMVVAIGIRGETDAKLFDLADKFFWVYMGKLGTLIERLKQEEVTQVVIAGQVQHKNIFSSLHFDLKAIGLLRQVRDKRADSILSAIVETLEKENIHVLPSTTFLSHFLSEEGLLSRRKPNKKEKKDIIFGTLVAREIAKNDIGQTVVVKDESVVAIEAMEGTDETIKRAGNIAGEGCVVIKVSKPKQDMRFDVPIIGKETIYSMIQAKASALAIDAHRSFFLDQDESLSLINKNKISLLGQAYDK